MPAAPRAILGGMMRTLRTWLAAPGFIEVMAKSTFAAILLYAAVFTFKALT